MVATIKYFDIVNGSDSAPGDGTIDHPFKTLAATSTAAGAGANEARALKTPDKTSMSQNMAVTKNTKLMTLTTAVTTTISDCEANWTAGTANITPASDTTNYKAGTKSQKLTANASFTTGLVGYIAMASTSYADRQQITLWFRSDGTWNAGDFTLSLCTNNDGTGAVNTINIPAYPVVNRWQSVTVDLATNMTGVCLSVAINAVATFTSKSIWVDNIDACKDKADGDSLNLCSWIGTGIAGEAWYSIQSIVGTAITIDQECGTAGPSAVKTYQGPTYASTTAYKVEPYRRIAITATAAHETLSVSGTSAAARFVVSGGWENVGGTPTKTGYTFFTGCNGQGYGFNSANHPYVEWDHLGTSRINYAFNITGSSIANYLHDCFVSNTAAFGVNAPSLHSFVVINYYHTGGLTMGIQTGGGSTTYNDSIYLENCMCDGITGTAAGSGGFYMSGTRGFNLKARGCTCAINQTGYENSYINTLDGSNSTYVVSQFTGEITIECLTVNTGETIWYYNNGSGANYPSLYGCGISNINGDTTDNRYYCNRGTVLMETKSGVKRWKFSPTLASDVYAGMSKPIYGPIICKSGQAINISARIQRSNTGIAARIRIPAYSILGVTSEVVSSITADADTDQTVSLATITPSENGVIFLWADCYGGTTYNAWFDQVSVT